MRNTILTTKQLLTGHSSAQGNVKLHFDLFFTAVFIVGWQGMAKLWKYRIDASAGKSVIAVGCA